MPTATTLITAAEMKNSTGAQYAISKDVETARVDGAIQAASERLETWIGTALYEDALKGTDTTGLGSLSATELRKRLRQRQVLKLAEGHLAMAFLIPNLNTVVTPKGITVEAKEEGKTTVRYLTPQQVKEAAKAWFDQASILAQPYLLEGNVPPADIEIGADIDTGVTILGRITSHS
jgi:hypothetical protein